MFYFLWPVAMTDLSLISIINLYKNILNWSFSKILAGEYLFLIIISTRQPLVDV
jgi:hypothetical protein